MSTTRRPDYWVQACTELGQRDEIMSELIGKYRDSELRYRSDPLVTLARSIVAQQISVKAAESIWLRLVSALGEVSAQRLARVRLPTLRAAGLSERKAIYLKNIGAHFHHKWIDPERWPAMDDEAVIDDLSQLHGIGRWTAEMFLIFNLQRPNIFPIADIGLMRAISTHYNSGRPVGARKMRELERRWQPWRTVATWYLWRSLDPIVVEY